MDDAERAAVIRRRRMVRRIAPAGVVAGSWIAPSVHVPAVSAQHAAAVTVASADEPVAARPVRWGWTPLRGLASSS
jgi:hypothetical protein